MKARLIFACAWLVASAPVALAHSFNVVIAVPDAVSQQTRDEMSAAFLIASEERDGHDNQESDGHLGGLDVYLTLSALRDTRRIAAADPDIVSLPLNGDAAAGDAVVLGALSLASPQAIAFLAGAAGPGFDPFARRFAARLGRAPGPEAAAAYVAARRIDLAVRALGGVDDRAGLKDLLVPR